MFERLVRFFLDNPKFNYTLFFMIILMGLWSYHQLPKEKFPILDMDSISVSGAYSGASNDMLDRISVDEIENEIESISGIDEIRSSISSNRFSIRIELEKGVDKMKVLDEVKQAVDSSRDALPDDMREPKAVANERGGSVINISIASEELSYDDLIENARDIRDDLLKVEGISNIDIYGDSDRSIRVIIDTQRMESYGFQIDDAVNAIKNIFYIHPLGKLEGKNHYYVSTPGGQQTLDDYANLKLLINGKQIYLREIATVEKTREDLTRLSRIDGKRNISLQLDKTEESNAIEIAKEVKERIKRYNKQYPEMTVNFYDDDAASIRDRLNIVISNIIMATILVTLLMYVLINARIAFVVMLGIPTSFLMAIAFFYLQGYSINMISLIGILIAIGILVDDAVIVSENIQRHLEEGMSIHDACILGVKEVGLPVTMATLTTIFAFLPLLMLTGHLGNFFEMIAIAISSLVVASLIEAFFFLPIHAAHVITPKSRPLDWSKANRLYLVILRRLMHHKRIFLLIFLVGVPVAIYYGFQASRMQGFPAVDTNVINISGKLNINTNVEETEAIAKQIEKRILEKKDALYIHTISTTSGMWRNFRQQRQTGENLFLIYVELKDRAPENFVDKYITPYLSFDWDKEPGERPMDNKEVVKELKKLLKGVKKEFALEEFGVIGRRIGRPRADVEISVVHPNTEVQIQAIERLKSALREMKGVTSVGDDGEFGVDELKIVPNKYGESMGLTEAVLASRVAKLFLENRLTHALSDDELVDVVVETYRKDDIESLKQLKIQTPAGGYVVLSDVADFKQQKQFLKIDKYDGKRIKSVFANTDSELLTASEATQKLQPILEELKAEGVEILEFGEAERRKQFFGDLQVAFAISLLLMSLSLLYMFKNFSDALIVLSVIPFSVLGVLIGHFIMGMQLANPSFVGMFGLAGVVINDGIIMMSFIQKAKNFEDFLKKASQRFRPVVVTTVTTVIGLSTLIFFATGHSKMMQPLAVSLGYGLVWGTILNLFYLPAIYGVVHRVKDKNYEE